MRTSFHHQPEAQHPISSAIHKLPADYPIFTPDSDRRADMLPCPFSADFVAEVI
jgi:hypothetical protein